LTEEHVAEKTNFVYIPTLNTTAIVIGVLQVNKSYTWNLVQFLQHSPSENFRSICHISCFIGLFPMAVVLRLIFI